MFLFGSKVDKAAEQVISSESEKFFTEFHKLFTQAYMNEVSSASKESANASSSDTDYSLKTMMKGLLLSQAPIRDAPIAEGQLSKQGGSVSSWKKRHFIVLNEKNNYKIEYYEGKGGKLKGDIDGAGYSVAPFQQSDIEQFGPHGLKLVPYQAARRTWYLRFDNDKMCVEWSAILQNAVFKAGPTSDPNPLVAASFHLAFELLQCRYNYTEYSRPYGREVDQLEDMLYSVLEEKGVKQSEKVEKIIRPAAESGWQTVCSNATSRLAAYRESFHTHAETLAQHEKGLRGQILGRIGANLESFLAQKQTSALRPIMEAMMDPLSQAFGEAVRSFYTILSTKAQAKELDGRDKRASTLRALVHGLEFHLQSDSMLFWSSQVLNNMFPDPFTTSVFLKSKYPHLIAVRECINAVGSLLYRALHTYEGAVNDAIEHTPATYVARLLTVIHQLVHDSKRMIRGMVHKIMHALLRKNLLMLMPQYLADTAEINFTQGISPDLAVYFDAERVLLNTVFDFAEKFVSDFLTPFFVDCDTSIDGIEKELVATGNNEPSSSGGTNRLSNKHISLSTTRLSVGSSSGASRLVATDVSAPAGSPDVGRSSFDQRKPLRTSGGALSTSLRSSNSPAPSPMGSPMTPHKAAIGIALPGLSRSPLSPTPKAQKAPESESSSAVAETKELSVAELEAQNAKALASLSDLSI